jgi:DNA-binding transcriptional ArsR family regulator
MSELNSTKAFDVLAEWRIKRMPYPPNEPKDTYDERVKRWALSSISLEERAQDIFLYLEKAKMATIVDLAGHFEKGEAEIQRHLDSLYAAGLIDRIGKAYLAEREISASIVGRLLPRITETLRAIAKVESESRSARDFLKKMNGRAFSNIGSAVGACKGIIRAGGSPVVRVVGVQGYGHKSIEVEGPVEECDYSPPHIVIISSGGEKVVIGGRDESGVDVKAHTIIIKGEPYE